MDSASDIGIKVLHSFYSSERDVYSRMVFKLEIDPSMAMKIIAFWLWLQETANTDIIRRVKTFTDPGLMAVSLLGENYLKGASECIMNGTSNSFNERAIAGVNHYLNKVCYKAFDDIKDKAELEKAKKRLEALTIEDLLPDIRESASRKAYLSNNGFGRTAPMQTHHDLLTDLPEPSSASAYTSNIEDGTNAAQELSPTAKAYFPSSRSTITNSLTRSFSAPTNYTKNIPTNQNASVLPYLPQQSSFSAPNTPLNPSTLPLSTTQNILEARGKSVILNTLPNPLIVGSPSQQDIHPDERTLFVTFSNGWPLNTEEIYYFFSLEYGNDLERIYIEEPAERRDPQYAHVTFRHIETIFQVLGDEAKKKFLTNGKHLWARRFIPKKKKFNNINVNCSATAAGAATGDYNNNYN
ncbi:hypothetical protein LUZ60_013733 [Juncus effusus]|nr:hypothetical protein LUZ60_013733 [Juncus effusus]